MNKFFALFMILAAGLAMKVAKAEPPTATKDLEIGHLFAVPYNGADLQHNFLYFTAKESLTFGEHWGFVGALRGGGEAGVLPNKKLRGESDIRELTLSYTQEKFRVRTGFQEMSWGETFGFYIADLVNPRDFRDPLLNDLGWIRLPVFMVNGQFYFGALTLQLIFTPVPRGPKNVYEETPSRPNSDFPSEGGAKLNYLFENGLDLGAFWYAHWNRQPVFLVSPEGLSPLHYSVHSLGLTASQASGSSWVFRLDSVVNLGQPIQNQITDVVRTTTDWQSIVGADFTTEGDWTFGLQYQAEWQKPAVFQWGSARAAKKWFAGKLETATFLFFGLNNDDLWLQPQVNWNATSSLTVSLRSDLLLKSVSSHVGILEPYQNSDRFLSWLIYHF